jgi:hypothetical protein
MLLATEISVLQRNLLPLYFTLKMETSVPHYQITKPSGFVSHMTVILITTAEIASDAVI